MAERQKKTAEQRAQESLATAERVKEKADDRVAAAQAVVATLKVAQEKAHARLAHVGIHPDLPEEVRAKYAAPIAEEPDPEPEGELVPDKADEWQTDPEQREPGLMATEGTRPDPVQ